MPVLGSGSTQPLDSPRRAVRTRRVLSGQSATEFALVVPVFLLFIFGIIQAALVLKANIAVTQAASDAAHVLAAQASTIPANLTNPWQADTAGLQAIRAALASQDLNGIVEVDVASVDGNGNPISALVQNSTDLTSTLVATRTIPLLNTYVYSPSGTGACQVDQFNLTDPLTSPFSPCSLPWNGSEFDPKANQNGRNDQRCTEDRVMVKLTYHYADFIFPIHFNLTLIGQDYTVLEPRQFLGGNAGYQSTIPSC